ncbi:MAG: Origin recognition complex, subunit 1 [Geoglossum simile]|nr:MAG: Origin recognition complex, subunit 1 [Geoglossum simile]
MAVTPRKKKVLGAVFTPKSRRSVVSPQKLITPTHKRVSVKKPLEFTPLGTRFLSPSRVLSSPFQIARARLHVSSVPATLPCREQEFATVYSHLVAAISDGSGSCVYISGTPGTGKTATVREVVSQLHAAAQDEELDDFVFVEINSMKVTDPHQSYSLLWEALKGERVSPSHALDLLEREFANPNPRRKPCVVLMDELDQLVTKNQSVMYNFFNWPGLRHSRLIVLAVANTMDLPERTLSNKISSLTRIAFPGYTHDQLMKIIQSRLEGVPGTVVDPDAVQFASRKVAAVSGDARRALDICRRAVEIAELEGLNNDSGDDDDDNDLFSSTPSKAGSRNDRYPLNFNKTSGKVTINTIKQAINEATTSPLQQYLRSLPLSSKLLLAAIVARIRRTGISESTLSDVIEEAKRIGKMADNVPIQEYLLVEPLYSGQNNVTMKGLRNATTQAARVLGLSAATVELMDAGVIGVESRKGERTGRIRLNIGDEEVKLALKDDLQSRGLGFSA